MKLSTQLCSLVFCSLLWSISTEASPNSAVFASYATVEESTLYIQGGVNTISGDNMYQFYSLDLTKNWDISNQPWSEVITADPIPAKLETWGHSISLSRNQKTLTFWNINGSVSYAASFHLDTNTWEALPPLNLLTKKHFSVEIIKAATDPRTDQVYIPGGSDKGMLVYSPDSKSSTALELGPSGKNGTYWSAYSFVWSDVRKSFLYFGGYDFPGAGSLYFYEYSPGRLSPWSPLSTSGSAPPALVGSCMVPAYSGTKMLVYGGSSNDEAGFDTLYILDVPTMTWSQGAKYQPRFGMVCSVSGDYLIVWGGFGISQSRDDPGKTIPIDETLIIYNIKTAQWTTQFIANDNGNKKVAIIGGSAGGVAVIILIVGVMVFRKRHRRLQKQKQEIQVSSPLQVILEQDIEEEPMEKMYFRDNQPRLAGAITSQQSIQKTQPFRITPPKSTHSNSPQYIYAHGPQQDHLDPPSWRTSLSPSQRVRSVSSSRSSSTLVATPTMSASPRYPSRQHQNRSPQQQQRQSITHDPPTRRSTRHPQGRNTPEPTPNSNHSIQYQLDALHAEANRLQAMLHP